MSQDIENNQTIVLPQEQKNNINAIVEFLDQEFEKIHKVLWDKIVGDNGSSAIVNGYLSVLGTSTNFAITSAENALNPDGGVKGFRFKMSKYLGSGGGIAIEIGKFFDDNDATEANWGYVASVIGHEFLLKMGQLSYLRNFANVSLFGFAINVAIDMLVVPAVGELINWIVSEGEINNEALTFNSPTDKYYHYYDSVDNTSYSYTNTLPENWTQLDEVQTSEEAIHFETMLDNTKQIFSLAPTDKIVMIEPNNEGEYVIEQSSQKLDLVNSIDFITSSSFVTSNIEIIAGEELDVGKYGKHKVESGDTVLELASEKYPDLSVKDIVKLNTWLIDDDRITFKYGVVYLSDGNSIDNSGNKNHTMLGEDVDDVLIDHNGGDDTLMGKGGDDYIEGGIGDDWLHGGSGDDTIYTNAKTPKDIETSATTNTVYGGDGDDIFINNLDYCSFVEVG